MLSESDEMDFQAGRIMQRTINEFFDGNAVAYVQALWHWFDYEVPEVWEPIPKFERTKEYMSIRNSGNPRGLSYAKAKETFPNSLTLITRFHLYQQVTKDLPHVKVPMVVNCLDMSNSKRFWRIIRNEEDKEEHLEAKLERLAKKRSATDQMSGEMDMKKFKDAITGLAYDYLFKSTLRKLYLEYQMKGLTEKSEFLMDKYGLK